MSFVDTVRPGARWWEEEGRRIGAALDTQTCLLVAAVDPENAAAVALGIGAAQAKRRRVVVADLVGELAAIQRLVPPDQADGVGDSFRYGVSLNRIARAVGTTGNLFVLPSGAEPVVDAEIYTHDRWRRLVAGFRDVEALLLLVVPPSAPGLEVLARHADGAIVAGEVTLPSGIPVLADARPPASTARRAATAAAPTPADLKAVPSAADDPEQRAVPEEALELPQRRRWRTPALVAAAALLVAGVAAVAILARRTRFEEGPVVAAAPSADTATPRMVDSAAAAVAVEALPIANPGDSAAAAAYAVELAKYSTSLGALLQVRDELPATVPGRTFAVVPIGAEGTIWYRVLAGVTPSRVEADSLLRALRAARIVGDTAGGAVVRVPLAFLLEEGVTPVAATVRLRQYLARGVPAYVLRRPDGSLALYAGAFETAEQAALLAPTLRAAGVEPTLAYRLGRTF